METKRKDIKTQLQQGYRLQTLMHRVNKETLKEQHMKQQSGKAKGVDDVTKEEYEENLEENLETLVERMKKFSYRPQAVRRVYIPKSNGKLIFDVKYDIAENTFPYNAIAKTDSSLLVRFAYSLDNENWTYVNNVISTNNSNITPLMGNYFDISGLKSTLSVKTNYELTSSPGKTEKIFWKSETVIIPNNNLKDSQIKANFYVEYRNNE